MQTYPKAQQETRKGNGQGRKAKKVTKTKLLYIRTSTKPKAKHKLLPGVLQQYINLKDTIAVAKTSDS